MEPGTVFGLSQDLVAGLDIHRNEVKGVVVPPVEYPLNPAPGPERVVVVPGMNSKPPAIWSGSTPRASNSLPISHRIRFQAR